jgi:hypothetical protein
MANEDTNRAIQPDDWKINMGDAWQVLWWCRYLGLTKAQLEAAVREAGPLILDVKRYMGRQPGLQPTEAPPVKPPAKKRTALMAARYAGRLQVLS